jgi:hypothetical protein
VAVLEERMINRREGIVMNKKFSRPFGGISVWGIGAV